MNGKFGFRLGDTRRCIEQDFQLSLQPILSVMDP